MINLARPGLARPDPTWLQHRRDRAREPHHSPVNDETIAVALAAGIAGMLALETRASSGVGVAISVTTIPGAAYLGVAVGLREFGNVGGAFAVLGTNVAMLVVVLRPRSPFNALSSGVRSPTGRGRPC